MSFTSTQTTRKTKKHVLAGAKTYSAIRKINVYYLNAKVTTKKMETQRNVFVYNLKKTPTFNKYGNTSKVT
jgi:hypothetical protein